MKNKNLEELKDIFESELREILSKYIWKPNSADVRNLIIKDIQEAFFNHKITPRAVVIDKITNEMVDNGKILFKIKEGRKEYTFNQYIEKLCNSLSIEDEGDNI
jgi:hypothetical protein